MFNTDLDKKFDGLSLMDGDPGYQQQNLTENISGTATASGSSQISPISSFSKKSLLSSSLATERFNKLQNLAQAQQKPNVMVSPKQPFFTLEDTHVHVHTHALVNSQPIPGRMYTDDHPEPELLASSVGKEIGGRLVPSSSAISLLSLNDHHSDLDTAFSTVKTSFNMTSPKYNNSYSTNGNENIPLSQAPQYFPQNLQMHSTQPQVGVPAPFMDRRNSFSNSMSMLSSRNSITHQRLQPYQKFTSPPPPSQQQQQQQQAAINLSSIPVPVSPPMHQQEFYHASSIPISINRMVVPDSPNLDPTSVGGSPSKFWLTSKTPPRSVAGSLSRNSRLYFQQQHQQQQPAAAVLAQQQPSQPPIIHSQTVRPMHISIADNYTTLATSTSLHRGDNSPTLEPVQTPLEDLPMTPLYLGTRGSIGSSMNDSYFGTFPESRGILSPEPPNHTLHSQIHSQLEGILETKQSDDEKDEVSDSDMQI